MMDWLYPWYHWCRWQTQGALLAGFSLRTEGQRNVPRTGPALLLANHQSYLDPPLVGVAVRRRPHYLARKTLYRNPLVATLIWSLNGVPVDQDGVAKEGLKTIIGLLQSGNAVVVFPEGTRTPDGEIHPFQPGIHLLLRRAPVPVIPVGIAGAYDAFSRHHRFPCFSPLFWPATGSDMAVSVGQPLPGKRFADLPRQQALNELYEAVQAAKDRAEKLRRSRRLNQ